MRSTLTLLIERDRILAVRARQNRTQWTDQIALGSRESLVECVKALLDRAPRSRWKPRVRVQLGFPFAQVKQLDGLPRTTRRRVATQIVRENANAFFLRVSPSLCVPEVHEARDGTRWAAAYDRAVVDEIGGALAAHGWRVESVEPAASMLWTEELRSVRNVFAWRLGQSAARSRRMTRWLLAGVNVLVVSTAAAALVAPMIKRHRWAIETAGELSRNGGVSGEARAAFAELAHVTRSIAAVQAFEARRGAVTTLLGRVAESLPDSTAIATLHVDSVEVSLVAVAPRVAEALSALAAIDSGSGPRITSNVTREVSANVRLERGAFRFRYEKARGRPIVATTSRGTERR